MPNARIVIGAMSGTSADGVDAAAVRIRGRGTSMSVGLLAHCHHNYPKNLREMIFRARAAGDPVLLGDLARMAREISLAYAAAAREAMRAAKIRAQEVAAIAAHGQTLFHDPPNTIQWLDPALLASETDCTVVSDFRRADCAAGGQGAPLVPFADYVLFRHPAKTRVLLNLGGIGNLTFLRAGGAMSEVIAFDTGPGNCISDALIRTADPAGPGIDLDGAVAARGAPIELLLQQALADPYFKQPPPRSTDVPAMLSVFHAARVALGKIDPLHDLVHTACVLTVTTVANAIRMYCNPYPDELIVSGGGVRNTTLMNLFRHQLGNLPVTTIDELGIPSEAKEAIAFALLGAATIDGEPSNIPAATGARRAVVLGSITPRP